MAKRPPPAPADSWPALDLPIKPPFAPMEAKLVADLPEDGWLYEPKWDGFRCLAFRDGDTIALQSKSGQPLHRYFPELVEALKLLPAKKFVIDSEILIPKGETFSFDALLQRIHPAESRVKKLSAEIPSIVHVFDLLHDGEKVWKDEKLEARRERLQEFAREQFPSSERVKLSQATRDLSVADQWRVELRPLGIDGMIAKKLDEPYHSGDRHAMQKAKWKRTVDCVVGGFRYGSTSKSVGSLLLGLYAEDGKLHHVGYTSTVPHKERKELTKKLEAMKGGGFTGRSPGGKSRWATERSGEWEPVEPTLVVEVSYDHFTTGRFRHGTAFQRWRPDKDPKMCTFDQVQK